MTLETSSTATQLAQHEPTGVLTPSEAVTSAIHAWVSGLDIAIRGAEFVVDTPACPDSFWPLPPDTKVWAIPGRNPKLRLPNESEESFLTRRRIAVQTVGFVVRYGLGLGLAPEVSLNGIFVIGGRPSMYAEQMVALIKARGHGHRVVERTAERCVVEVRHRSESDWEAFEFSMEDAVVAGYVKGKGPNKDGKGGNEKYSTDPKAMLYARASSIACKTKFPEDLRGMVTYEELQDERAQDDSEVRVITKVTASDIKARVARAEPAPAPVEAGPRQEQLDHSVATEAAARVEQQQAAAEPVGETGEVATLAQRRKIGALLRKLELGTEADKEAALTVISFIVERQVDSTQDLTTTEAGAVIRRLEGLEGEPEPKWRAEIRFMVAGANGAEQIASTEGADRG